MLEETDLHRRVEEFVYMEARLQDEHLYDEWEALWTDDAHYWVPANGDDIDRERKISYINDNRPRISTRVKQLKTRHRHSQIPPSRMRRLISNLEIEAGGEEIIAGSNFILMEHRSTRGMTTWAGRTVHRLRPENGSFKLVQKKVMLINNYVEIPTMSFLI
ncbi:MAG: aromatic-ring-hydroxylating dioxygenase subunit beta [Rubrobacteraceae bacterium]